VVAQAWHEKPEDLDIVNVSLSPTNLKRDFSEKYRHLRISKRIMKLDRWSDHWPRQFHAHLLPPDPETGQGRALCSLYCGCEGLDIESIKKRPDFNSQSRCRFDVGSPINPGLVKAQIEGGFVQG
jgi:hypothetical protein